MRSHMNEQLYHCQACSYEWYYPHSNGRSCANCGSENIYRYLEPKFQPQQWVRYRPLGALFSSRTAQVAEVRPDEQGGWVYLLPRDLYPPDGCMYGEFPEGALELGESEGDRKLSNY